MTNSEDHYKEKMAAAVNKLIDHVNGGAFDGFFSDDCPADFTFFDIYSYRTQCLGESIDDYTFGDVLSNAIYGAAYQLAKEMNLNREELLNNSRDCNYYDTELYNVDLYKASIEDYDGDEDEAEANAEVEPDLDRIAEEIIHQFDKTAGDYSNSDKVFSFWNGEGLELSDDDEEDEEEDGENDGDHKTKESQDDVDKRIAADVEHDVKILKEWFSDKPVDDNTGEDLEDNSDDDDDEAVYDDDSDDDDDFDDDGGGTECRTCPMPVGSDEPKRLVDDIRRVHRRSQLYDSFSVAGVQYHEAAEAWPGLFVGAPVRIVRDRKNPFDSKAIALYSTPLSQTPDGLVSLNNLRTTAAVDGSFMLGFVPRYRNTGLAALLDNGYACRIHAEISELRWNPPMHRIDVNIYIDRDPEAEPEAPYIYDVLGEIEMKTLARELALTGSICFNYDIDDETEEFSMPNEGDTVYMINHSSQSGWTIYRLLITRMNLRQSRDHIEYIMANTYGPVRVPSSQFSWADDDEQLYLEPIHKAQKRLQAELEKLFGPADD